MKKTTKLRYDDLEIDKIPGAWVLTYWPPDRAGEALRLKFSHTSIYDPDEITAEIRLAETDPLLMRPGMRFRGRIEIGRTPGILQIPLAAIQASASGPTVMKMVGGSATPTPVELGRRSRDSVEVVRGLAPGDQVRLRAAEGQKDQNAFRLGAS